MRAMVRSKGDVMVAGAVEQAQELNKIGFPEFTAKLVTDTFDALMVANMKQTELYIGLVQQVAKSLSTYVNDTKDDATSAELLSFLEAIVPAAASDEGDTGIAPGTALTADQAAALNTALAVPDDLPQPTTYASGDGFGADHDSDEWAALLDAIAIRIAANKYDLLQEMVRQGVLRLVVENGTIETKLTFSTSATSSMTRDTSVYGRTTTNKRSGAGAGWLLSPLFSAKERTNSTKLTVTTTKTANRDISGSHVQIYGGVTINFKTDYQPLT
jgi:hypothetical protein